MEVSALQALIRDSKLVSDKSKEGPTNHSEYVSNSYLTVLERMLTGTPQFFGNEKFLKFGNELHKRYLEPRVKKVKLDSMQEWQMKIMLKALKNYEPLASVWDLSKREIVNVHEVYGQKVKVVLDMEYRKKGRDIKTTSCRNYDEFLKKAVEYHYFSQAYLYIEARKLKQFDFDAVTKPRKDQDETSKVFTLTAQDYPILLKEGEDRVKRLIDIYKSLRKFYGYTA